MQMERENVFQVEEGTYQKAADRKEPENLPVSVCDPGGKWLMSRLETLCVHSWLICI